MLLPVMALAVTTGVTATMLEGSLSAAVTVPVVVIVPEVYPIFVAAIDGPAVGVSAVEIALATQLAPVPAARLSVTTTWPIWALKS